MTGMMDSPLLAIGLLLALIGLIAGLFLAGRIYGARQVKSDHDGSQAVGDAETTVAGDPESDQGSGGP